MPPTSGSIPEANNAMSNTLSAQVPAGDSSPTPTSQAPAWKKRRLSRSHATSTVELPGSYNFTLGAVDNQATWEHHEQQAELTVSQYLNDDASKVRSRATSEEYTRPSEELDTVTKIFNARTNAKMRSSDFDPQTWSTRDPAENFISTWEGRLGKYPRVRDALQGLSKFRTLPSEDEELPPTPFRELNLMMDYVHKSFGSAVVQQDLVANLRFLNQLGQPPALRLLPSSELVGFEQAIRPGFQKLWEAF
ncbi:MAG: hypothetical protein Q9221_006864 [Calogaya cf. arnoldii]